MLAAVEEAGNTLHLQGQSLACGYYVNELIYHLLPRDDPAPHLFANYWSVVSSLDDLTRRDSALRQFELELLVQIGYEPLLDHDYVTGEPVVADSVYRYRVPEGPFAVAVHEDNSEVLAYRVDEGSVGQSAGTGQPGTGQHGSGQHGGGQHGSGASPANESQHGFRISGQTLLDLAQGVFHNPLTLKEARDLMRLLIHYQLDGRELLSRTLFNSYRTLSRSSREH